MTDAPEGGQPMQAGLPDPLLAWVLPHEEPYGSPVFVQQVYRSHGKHGLHFAVTGPSADRRREPIIDQAGMRKLRAIIDWMLGEGGGAKAEPPKLLSGTRVRLLTPLYRADNEVEFGSFTTASVVYHTKDGWVAIVVDGDTTTREVPRDAVEPI